MTVDGNCQRKLQPPGSFMLDSPVHDNQIPKLFVKARSKFSDPSSPILSPLERDVSWSSDRKALGVK